MERSEYAAIVHRKLGDLGSDMSIQAEGDQTEGDLTDALDSALRDCGFSAVTEATEGPQIQAILIGMEYYAVEGLFLHWVARPTTQQGAGASGLHLMVQTETSIQSLRMGVRMLKEKYEKALTRIGASLAVVGQATGGAVLLDHTQDTMEHLVTGTHKLPWFDEGYFTT